jgi:hypothetical protein
MPTIRHPGASEPTHISAEEFNKTKTKQRKPTKPDSHQTDQNLKSYSSAKLKGCSEAAANSKKVAWKLTSRNLRASKHSNREY